MLTPAEPFWAPVLGRSWCSLPSLPLIKVILEALSPQLNFSQKLAVLRNGERDSRRLYVYVPARRHRFRPREVNKNKFTRREAQHKR